MISVQSTYEICIVSLFLGKCSVLASLSVKNEAPAPVTIMALAATMDPPGR